jgi:hypothetical protein
LNDETLLSSQFDLDDPELMVEAIGFKPTSVNVHGLTALIRKLGRDCTPDQFMREFVQNPIY